MESISEVEPTGVADGSGGVRERSIRKASGLSSGENGVTCPLAEGPWGDGTGHGRWDSSVTRVVLESQEPVRPPSRNVSYTDSLMCGSGVRGEEEGSHRSGSRHWPWMVFRARRLGSVWTGRGRRPSLLEARRLGTGGPNGGQGPAASRDPESWRLMAAAHGALGSKRSVLLSLNQGQLRSCLGPGDTEIRESFGKRCSGGLQGRKVAGGE